MNDNSARESEPMTYGRDMIEQHVRRELRPVDPDAPEWAAQVERIVEEVREEFGSNDFHDRARIAQWVRSIAREEAMPDASTRERHRPAVGTIAHDGSTGESRATFENGVTLTVSYQNESAERGFICDLTHPTMLTETWAEWPSERPPAVVLIELLSEFYNAKDRTTVASLDAFMDEVRPSQPLQSGSGKGVPSQTLLDTLNGRTSIVLDPDGADLDELVESLPEEKTDDIIIEEREEESESDERR